MCEDCETDDCECDLELCDGCGKPMPNGPEYITECGMSVGECCDDSVSCRYYDDIGETFCTWIGN